LRVAGKADLVICSIKHPTDPLKVSRGTIQLNKNILSLGKTSISIRLRYVLIPGLTDSLDMLNDLKSILKSIRNLEKIEVLAFNNLAREKWIALGKENDLFNSIQHVVDEKVIQRVEKILLS